MLFHRRTLVAVLLALGTPAFAAAQEALPEPPQDNSREELLPSLLPALKRPSTEELERAQRSKAEAQGVKRLPPVSAIEEIPLPAVAPSSITPFSQRERRVNLVRGNEVVTLSNSALRNSGLFEMSLRNSAPLAQSYQLLQADTLQVHQLDVQVEKEKEKEKEATERLKAVRDQKDARISPQMTRDLETDAQTQTARREDVESARLIMRDQQIAHQAEFEEMLWSVGLNGAKIGTVSSMDRSSAAQPDHFILVKAIEDSASNNMGYTRTVVYPSGEFGATTVPSEYLLPLPVEPNDLFFDKGAANNTQRAPDGLMLPLTSDPTKNPVIQVLAFTQGYLYYDTGFVTNNGRFAEEVSLKSRHDPRAGQTYMFSIEKNSLTDFSYFDLAANAQLMDIGGGNSLQFFTVANNDLNNDQLAVSSIGARAYNRDVGSMFEGWSVLAGQKQSIFGETSAIPAGLLANQTLIGTVNRSLNNVPQIGVEAPLTDYVTWKGALEGPYPEPADVYYGGVPADTITRLNRWPTLATNVMFKDKSTNNLLQLGGLLRTNGFETNATSVESFESGWGLSAIVQLHHHNSINFVGVAGGDGIGRYIQGIQYAAAANPATGSFEALSARGAFAGRQTSWYDECNKLTAVCSAAYGYSLMEDPDIANFDPNRKLHQAWLNYTRFVGDQVGIGMEYQYGYRQIASGDVGEDHRFLFVLTVRSAEAKKSTQVQSYVSAPVTGKGGLDEDRPLTGTIDEVRATQATISGRPIDDVVNQYQLGGSAFQQGL